MRTLGNGIIWSECTQPSILVAALVTLRSASMQSLYSIPRYAPPPSGSAPVYGRRLPCNRQQRRLSNLSIV